MMMNFKKVAGAGIAAVTFSLMASSAMAAFTGTAPAYATQGIPSSGAVTIPANTIVYTTDTTATGGTGNYTVVFTLPAGVTFTTTPAITVGGVGVTGTATLASGGNGANTATFLVNITAAAAAAPTLSFGQFGITGATALATPKTGITFPITEQITSTSTAGVPVQPAPTAASGTGALATSANALTTASTAPANALVVDINPTANGTKFLQGNPATDNTYADDGSFTYTVGTLLAANGTSNFAFTSTTLTETYAGATGGLSAAYLSPNGVCQTTATAQAGTANTVTGTISGAGIVFAGIPVATYSGTARELCLYTAGTALLAANPVGFTVTTAVDTTSLVATGINAYNYNGTVVTYPYAVNTSSSYASYIRIINKSASTPAVVTASVISDQGGVGVVQVESGLAANGNDLVPMSTITSNAGLTNTSGRYSITLFGPAPGGVAGVAFENLLLNPGGVVTQLQ